MSCDCSWDDVADAVDGIFKDKINPMIEVSFVREVCNNTLPSAMRLVLEWCFVHNNMSDPRLDIIKNGYIQIENRGTLGMENEMSFTDWLIQESKLKNQFFKYVQNSKDVFPEKLTAIQWTREFESWLRMGCPNE